MSRYASGKHARGQCQRCGIVYARNHLREDGENGLLVCGECYDEYHPSKRPVDVTDIQTIYKPAPDLDKAASTTTVTPITEVFGWDDNTYFGS